MGKASRWFRSILGLKKSSDQSPQPSTTTTTSTQFDSKPAKEKRKWSFGKSFREKEDRHLTTGRSNGEVSSVHHRSSSLEYINGVVDHNKHAIAVAAATSAVAEAAVAAAQAAAAVVRLTSSGRCNCSSSYNRNFATALHNFAAVKIQSAFRGYLAKRAMRALKGLVKLQALVRGHIVRKQTEETWRRIQFLVRAQERACAGRRALVSDSPLSTSKSSHYLYTGPATPEKFEHNVRVKPTRHNQPTKLKRNRSASKSSRVTNGHFEVDDEENNVKILQIDPGKPHSMTTTKDSTTHQTGQSHSTSGEVQSLSHLNFTNGNEEGSFCTAEAENSPQLYYSASSSRGGSTSRRSRSGPFAPSKSYLSGYSNHPNYMACTQSSKAKLRSLSAPKQRTQFERSISAKRYSTHVHGFGHSRSNSEKIYETFHSKAYDGSGQLDRLLGMPY